MPTLPERSDVSSSGHRDWHSPAEWLRWFGRTTKRLLVLALGVAILGAGVVMLALPGPGLLVIIVGLAVLASEFVWAERALDRTTAKAATAASKVSASRSGRLALIASGLGMITGGALVAAFAGEQRVIGVSVAAAGLVGLATLLPRVQRWIGTKTEPATLPASGAPIPTLVVAVDPPSDSTPSASTTTATTPTTSTPTIASNASENGVPT